MKKARVQILFLAFGSMFIASALIEADGVSYEWMKATPPHMPPPRRAHCMAYDTARQQVVLFGGRSGNTYLNDTWIWNGSDWT